MLSFKPPCIISAKKTNNLLTLPLSKILDPPLVLTPILIVVITAGLGVKLEEPKMPHFLSLIVEAEHCSDFPVPEYTLTLIPQKLSQY